MCSRFGKVLARKVRQEDRLGHYAAGQYAIIALGTSPILCAAFAERVREAVEVAHVAVQGQSISLTVSIGVASIPGDVANSAFALLGLLFVAVGVKRNDFDDPGGDQAAPIAALAQTSGGK